jgi:hypothetical protein
MEIGPLIITEDSYIIVVISKIGNCLKSGVDTQSSLELRHCEICHPAPTVGPNMTKYGRLWINLHSKLDKSSHNRCPTVQAAWNALDMTPT